MVKSPDEPADEPVAHLRDEARKDDELIARLREDVRSVGGATTIEDDAPVETEPVYDEHGHQEP
jgi:hypothetical protein